MDSPKFNRRKRAHLTVVKDEKGVEHLVTFYPQENVIEFRPRKAHRTGHRTLKLKMNEAISLLRGQFQLPLA